MNGSVHEGVIYLAQSENIIQCFSCFLKNLVTGHGSKRLDAVCVRTQNMSRADDIKEKKPRMDNTFVYTKAQMIHILWL